MKGREDVIGNKENKVCSVTENGRIEGRMRDGESETGRERVGCGIGRDNI